MVKMLTVSVLLLSLLSGNAYGNVGYETAVKICRDTAHKYSLIVRYKDEGIDSKLFLRSVAPKLGLPRKDLEALVDRIYSNDLTASEVYDKIYINCLYSFSG